MSLSQRLAAAYWRRRYRWLHQRPANIAIPGGMVSFTFDDFPANATSSAAALLEARGWRATWYLAPGLVDSESVVGRICSWTDVESLHGRGHEIGNHTFSHLRCERVLHSRLRHEFERSQQAIEQRCPSDHFAFPFGAYDDSALVFFGRRFATLRSVEQGVNAGPTVDVNRLKANPVYESSDLAAIESLIESARRDDGWLILYTHDVCALPSPFGCTEGRFAAVLDAVGRSGVAVGTMSQACERAGITRRT